MLLKDKLTIKAPLGPPDERIRRNRLRLADFISAIESQVFRADGELRERIRALLGWDDATIASFVDSPLLAHSSPHASMNAFAPMFAYPWVQRSIQRLSEPYAAGKPLHIRTLVTHNNLGDLRWRPYAWWHRARDGRVRKTVLFSRNHSVRHKTLLSQPLPPIDLAICSDLDREAIELASRATNYAYFCMIYRMVVERHAGMHEPQGTIEVPINLLNAFTFEQEQLREWVELCQSQPELKIRTLNADGELVDLEAADCARYAANLRQTDRFPILCSNYLNFAQVYQLGITVMIGAEKMAVYTSEMNALIEQIYARTGRAYPIPQFIPVTNIPVERIMPLEAESSHCLRESGLSGSLPIGAVDHGPDIARRLDELLEMPYSDFFRTF